MLPRGSPPPAASAPAQGVARGAQRGGPSCRATTRACAPTRSYASSRWKRRELLLDLSQCAAEAVAEYVRRRLGPDCRPGIVVSIATAGDLVQWHRHGHLLLTDGAFSNDGAFHALENWDAEAVMKLFRERLLPRLVQRHAISEDLGR